MRLKGGQFGGHYSYQYSKVSAIFKAKADIKDGADVFLKDREVLSET
jgi:hypothetical protein